MANDDARDTLAALSQMLAGRKGASADSSYVAALYQKGVDGIGKKVGEEATELVMAAKDAQHGGDRDALVREAADLWFHSMVLLAHLDVDPVGVVDELERRFGISGLTEKAAREK